MSQTVCRHSFLSVRKILLDPAAFDNENTALVWEKGPSITTYFSLSSTSDRRIASPRQGKRRNTPATVSESLNLKRGPRPHKNIYRSVPRRR